MFPCCVIDYPDQASLNDWFCKLFVRLFSLPFKIKATYLLTKIYIYLK
nr:MAG TPA: hypothetical protein [Caudoviricetes sp.]